jgi:Xaa-Pro aminopeptidase
MERTLDELRRGAGEDSSLGEYEVQQRMVRSLEDMGLTTSNPPIVAVGPHSADPHFEPGPDRALPIRKGDLVMLDLWARKDEPGAIYADITWMAYMGDTVPDRYAAVFDVVRRARDAAFDYVRTSLEKGGAPLGWEADKAARTVIADAGYGDQFIHRTGHSLGEEVHGNGANLDNLETQDVRALIPGTCFTIEPGIYLSGDFGVRSEIDVIIEGRDAVITGGSAQQEIVPLLK